ncbi:MAG: histidine triad nucleotide-binding protein [Firmicutes bacterium]|nr:histidine triad nucleotide-binding protein [Bacillota bacterium]
MECIFCKIAAGELPAKKVFESEHVVAFEDIHKVAPVHVLVIPKVHRQSLLEVNPNDVDLLSGVQEAIRAVIKDTGIEQTGFRVITNSGAAAGQTVFHLHFHVIGGRELAMTLA